MKRKWSKSYPKELKSSLPIVEEIEALKEIKTIGFVKNDNTSDFNLICLKILKAVVFVNTSPSFSRSFADWFKSIVRTGVKGKIKKFLLG